jgi:transposase
MSLEDAPALIATLRETIRSQEALIAQQQATIARLEATVAQLQERLALGEGQKTSPPPWAKANRTERPPKERRKRAPEHNAGRPRSVPTRVEEHAYARCPDCDYALRGHTIDRRREVIELPLAPVEVIEHRVITRYCPVCQRWQAPPLDVGGQVLGQSRFGVRLMSLVAYLRTLLRLPLAQIQELLRTLWSVQVSEGALVDMLRRLAEATAPVLARMEEQVRGSPAVYSDETGWRENGENGYIWVRATPTGARRYTYTTSRAGAVAQDLLDDCTGVRCTDFYAAYNGVLGRKQRCWAHLLRDLHALKEAHPADAEVRVWAEALYALYQRGQECLSLDLSAAQRERAYRQLEERTRALGHCYAARDDHPCQTLAQRLLRHRGEFFEFVRVPEVEATNNLSERGLRSLVIARKISGGTRSAQGTTTRLDLASLFESWHAQGHNPFQACLAFLQTPSPQL